MLDSTLYMACVDPVTGELVPNTNSCAMCKRLIINAGISTIIIRNTKDDYTVINTRDWIFNDESLTGQTGY